MGIVEDLRKVIQDLVTPDLRAIDARLKTLEGLLLAFRSEVNVRFDKADQTMREMFREAEQRNETRNRELVTALNLEARTKRLEEGHLTLTQSLEGPKRIIRKDSTKKPT